MKDHDEIYNSVLRQRDEFVRSRESKRSRVRLNRLIPALAAAVCFIAVVGIALRFAPGGQKPSQTTETGLGSTSDEQPIIVHNDPTGTDAETGERIIFMVKIPLQYVNSESAHMSEGTPDGTDPDYISVPNYNDRGEQLVGVEYRIIDTRHPVKSCCDAFQKEYGIDPSSFLDPEIYFSETIPSLIGKELPIEETFGINSSLEDYFRHSWPGIGFEQKLVDVGLLTWEELGIVLTAYLKFDKQFTLFLYNYYQDYFEKLDEKYLKNKENIVIGNTVFQAFRILYASEELIAEMEADELVQEVTRYDRDFTLTFTPVNHGYVYGSFDDESTND